jgi:hypothetical protein
MIGVCGILLKMKPDGEFVNECGEDGEEEDYDCPAGQYMSATKSC